MIPEPTGTTAVATNPRVNKINGQRRCGSHELPKIQGNSRSNSSISVSAA
jgi:hypothetical protein